MESPVRVIILSMHAIEAYVVQVLRAGASGYLLKDADTVELGLALKAAMRGETYLSPADYTFRGQVLIATATKR